MEESLFQFEFPTIKPDIIKVIGVGGGGGNAVTHMYRSGIHDVTFVICNTDNQALLASEIPLKIQLGKSITAGLGAGSKPEVAKQAAEESEEDLIKLLSDGTKMVFITAGMGGGTGTGAAPVVARIAKEMGILTVAIVTIPFVFEGRDKILQALRGVEEIAKHVDALLVVNNERLREIYRDLTLFNAFKKADDTLTVAAKSIAEIITLTGHMNLDFADVEAVLKNGGVAIMSSGVASGDNRVLQAIDNALTSPLLNNNDVFKSKKILLNIAASSTAPLMMDEMDYVDGFMKKFNSNIKVIWGTGVDEELDDNVKVTILSTGFGIDSIPKMEEKRAFDSVQNWEEEEQKRMEEEERKRQEIELLNKYYDGIDSSHAGQPTKPKPIIFSNALLDNDEFIEKVLSHPTYNRTLQLVNSLRKESMDKK